jgi:hypothetical protein
MLLFGFFKCKRKSSSFIQNTLNIDGLIVSFDNMLNNRQPKASPALFART